MAVQPLPTLEPLTDEEIAEDFRAYWRSRHGRDPHEDDVALEVLSARMQRRIEELERARGLQRRPALTLVDGGAGDA
jgi:hypothetical protein